MADGQLNNLKIGAIIQARLNSSRLPGKVLMPLPLHSGEPILKKIIDEINCSPTLINHIIVATTISPVDDVIVNFCKNYNYNYFRGSEEDVLSRFIAISKDYQLDHIIRLTGDNPVLDIYYLEKVLNEHIINSNDYTYSVGLPTGMNIEIINSKALISLENFKLTNDEKEHVTLFFNKRKHRIQNFIIEPGNKYKDIRLTVDFPSDYALLSIIFQLSQTTGKKGIKLIDYLIENYKWLFDINSSNFQKRTFSTLDEELDVAIDILQKNELKNSVELLCKHKSKI